MAAVKFFLQYYADTFVDNHVFYKYLGVEKPIPFYWMTLGTLHGPSGVLQWRNIYGTEDNAEDYPTNFFNWSVSGSYPNWVNWKSFFITQGSELLDELTDKGFWRIPPGIWTFSHYLTKPATWGACAADVYRVKIEVLIYRGGMEIPLFDELTTNVNPVCPGVVLNPFVHYSAEQPGYTVLPGDRLIVKYYDEWNKVGYPYHYALQLQLGVSPYRSYFEMPPTETESPPGGKLTLVAGWRVGNIEMKDGEVKAEIRSRAQHLQTQITKLYSPDCRAVLGDAQCGIDLDDSLGTYSYDGEVTSITEDRRAFIDNAVPSDITEDVFQYGVLTWSAPDSAEPNHLNVGIAIEVKSFNATTGAFELVEAMIYEIAVGDKFNVKWGCDRSVDHCENRFNNLVNFRGDPYVPGYDQIEVQTKE